MNLKHLTRRMLSILGLQELPLNRQALMHGAIAARQVRTQARIGSLADVEFSIFSQWGEDGIIEWLVHNNSPMPTTFIEFGVENYTEANTRFLIQHRNWRGMVIDASHKHMEYLKADLIYWRHDLTAIEAFIDRDNIDPLFQSAGFSGEIGILSVDIDGNDYWVWEAIKSVNPQIVIAEYNSSFGNLLPLTIPYDPCFFRTTAHYSNLYYGASIAALDHLATTKGYTRLGTARAGSNVFYIRNDRLPQFADRIVDTRSRPSAFRESRSQDGRLTLLSREARSSAIGKCEVVNTVTGERGPLESFGELFSADWRDAMLGRLR